MKRLGIDLDDTLSDMMEVLVETYNKEFSEKLHIKDIASWDYLQYIKDKHKPVVSEYFKRMGWFTRPNPKDGAIEFVPQLSLRYELLVVTAYHPSACADKAAWLQAFFPCIPYQNVIFSNRKELIKLDYLIDDGVHNLVNFEGIPILFDRPWNRAEQFTAKGEHISRGYNWKHIYTMLNGEYTK